MFLLDQRMAKKMKIEVVDSNVTELWARSNEREAAEHLKAVQHEEKQHQEEMNHLQAQVDFALLEENELEINR